jgi:hypothetical protein
MFQPQTGQARSVQIGAERDLFSRIAASEGTACSAGGAVRAKTPREVDQGHYRDPMTECVDFAPARSTTR